METIKIINLLKKRRTNFLEIKNFSLKSGIYAFFFIGDEFPYFGDKVTKHHIIYIGKTEYSQKKRDEKTHFATGATGSSTVRKSIGSLLRTKNNLIPIPRNNLDYQKRRFSHFKFDTRSEEIITEWMINNLALAFYEYSGSRKEIKYLEAELINTLVPVLNISKNPKSSFRKFLQQLRKECAKIALSNNRYIKIKTTEKKKKNKSKNTNIMATSGKYINLWTRQRESIKEILRNSHLNKSLKLNAEDFKAVGQRKSYSFNLEFENGKVNNNIGGSAVARDLAQVLESSNEIKNILGEGHFKINMNKEFCLKVEKKSN